MVRCTVVLIVVVVLMCVGEGMGDVVVPVMCSFRRDAYLPKDEFPENMAAPLAGGRMHVTAKLPLSVNASMATSVLVNGVSPLDLYTSDPTQEYFDWARVQTSGNVVGVSFHTRNEAQWVPPIPAPPTPLALAVTVGNVTYGGVCIFSVSSLVTTWVTPERMGPLPELETSPAWVVHLESKNATCKVTNVTFLHAPLAQLSPALPLTLEPGQHVVLTLVPSVSRALSRGSMWSLEVESSCDDTSVGANSWQGWWGRAPSANFPIIMWPCPRDPCYPGGNETYWNVLRSTGLDGIYFPPIDKVDAYNGTVTSVAELVGMPSMASTSSCTSVKTLMDAYPVSGLQGIRSVEAGAETDVQNDYKMVPRIRRVANVSIFVAAEYPKVLTQSGSGTNRMVGALAGMADIHCGDAYIAACAGTMISEEHVLQPQYSLGYALNARNNQMPLSTVPFSQLFFKGWPYQAHGPALAVQVASALASGAKGLNFFRTCAEMTLSNLEAFEGGVAPVLRSARALDTLLYTGDVGSLSVTTSDDTGTPLAGNQKSFVTIVRNSTMVGMIVINFDASGYSNLGCHMLGEQRYWTFANHTVDKIVLGPSPDVASHDLHSVREVVNGEMVKVVDARAEHGGGGRVVWRRVGLGGLVPVRIFVWRYEQR